MAPVLTINLGLSDCFIFCSQLSFQATAVRRLPLLTFWVTVSQLLGVLMVGDTFGTVQFSPNISPTCCVYPPPRSCCCKRSK